jgi:hypothetical protein
VKENVNATVIRFDETKPLVLMLHASAMTPNKLEGLYPDLDVRFDLVRGHCAIRRFGLHALGDHWLIGHEEQRAGWNVVGKSRGTQSPCRSPCSVCDATAP